jgi:hypothetical protein
MAFTYLEVVNLALREVNEIPLSEANFTTTRGLHQFAKDAVNRAYFEISNTSQDWAWKRTERAGSDNTQQRQLTAGTQWYNIDTSAGETSVDWDSFLLTDKDIITNDPNVEPEVVRALEMMTYDTWLEQYREEDFKGNTGEPEYVIQHPSGKFGFTPVPDEDYFIEYFSSFSATRFVNHYDVIPFPEEFIDTLVAKVKQYLWMFRENDTQAAFAREQYKDSLENMQRVLLSTKETRMRAV